MTKIFDCSNSIERPEHRGYGGPFTNDIIRYLKENAYRFNCSFVNDIKKADVLLTNDVFPKEFVKLSLPKIKRMDGIYFQNEYKNRNLSLNDSAKIADHVIFISEFSKNSLYKLYGEIKNHTVILNQCDPMIFFPIKKKRELKTFIAAATHWDREEKRLDALLEFSKMDNNLIYLIGTCGKKLPNNVKSLGYISNPVDIAITFQNVDAMVCFSYKDACPKTVVQGVACGLPVLYADSGGLPEIVSVGVGIKDNKEICFENRQPSLDREEIYKSYLEFKNNYKWLSERVVDNNFNLMLEKYFKIVKSF
jgi:glycosyltransferase involved in cell wall biosynthesis